MKAKVSRVPSLIGAPLGYYDSASKDRTPITACKAIDITALCPKAKERAILLYAQITRGTHVQLCDYKNRSPQLMVFHMLPLLAKSANVDFFAQIWGIDAAALAKLVNKHAPPS